ncbi:MAG: 30S ribosomal protein S2 [Sediminibacterium sp.]|nr:30S ribosomal protein S2 [Sediminibacterium sp.]
MEQLTQQNLLDAGVHFGHLKKKWNPKMLPYIYNERKGIHIIDLNKTVENLDTCSQALKQIAKSGRKILFVATKKQAKDIVKECAKKLNMPFVTERWLGGMLTNFNTVRRSVKKMNSIEKLLSDGSADSLTKKEKLIYTRDKDKLESVLGGIANITRLPSAIFLVDIGHEHIALAEAKKLGIVTFGIVDTNCDPNKVDYPIPANDDATKSIELIITYITNAILEGLTERQAQREDEEVEDINNENEIKAKQLEEAAQADSVKSNKKSSQGNSGNSKSNAAPRKNYYRKK